MALVMVVVTKQAPRDPLACQWLESNTMQHSRCYARISHTPRHDGNHTNHTLCETPKKTSHTLRNPKYPKP